MVLTTTISQIELAIEGKIDFVKKTNPWGKSDEEKEEEKILSEPPNPEIAMKKLMIMAKRRQEANRRKFKSNVKKK